MDIATRPLFAVSGGGHLKVWKSLSSTIIRWQTSVKLHGSVQQSEVKVGVARIGQRQVVESNRFIVGGGNFEATIEVLDLTYLITIHKSMDLPTCNFTLVNETTARLIFVGDMGPHGSFWYYEHAGMYGGRYFDLSIHVQTVADQPPLTPAWAVTYTFSFQANIPATNVLAGPFSGKANE